MGADGVCKASPPCLPGPLHSAALTLARPPPVPACSRRGSRSALWLARRRLCVRMVQGAVQSRAGAEALLACLRQEIDPGDGGQPA